METHDPSDFAFPMPTLPPGIAVCDGIPCASWNTKCLTLTNEAGLDVAKGICHSVDAELVIDMDEKPLGKDRVAIQIAESLCEAEVLSVWMWSMHSWYISQVYLNGVSLYDHDQTSIYNNVVHALRQRIRSGVRSYDSSRERREPDRPPKKVVLLSAQAIPEVSSKVCCQKNCLQPFPRGQIEAIRSQIHIDSCVYFRKHCLLDIHRQIHQDARGKEMITLEGVEVCPTAWWTVHGISRPTFYRYKDMAKVGKRPEPHGDLGTKKPRKHIVQATATLRLLLESTVDQMPHKSRVLESGEKVSSMCLPSSFHSKDTLLEINDVNAYFNLQNVSVSGLSSIRRTSFSEYAPKSRGDSFARRGLYNTYKQLRSACTPRSHAQEKWSRILGTHLAGQRAHRELYYANQMMSEKSPDKVLTIIHDKMDHSKTASPHFSHKSKGTDSFMKMPVAVTGMIAHGHGDIQYAHDGLDIFPTDSNHTIGSIAKLLRDLESVPKHSSRELFHERRSSPLSKALLKGSKMCTDSLLPPTEDLVEAKCLPPTLTLQLDNALGDNKNGWVFAFYSLLIYKAIFREIYINFLIVGHTHEDIDDLFGHCSNKLKINDYPTLPRFMKSFIDCEKQHVISHLIEEVRDFKSFVERYLGTCGDYLEGHSTSQQFKFSKDFDGWPLMEYKNLCTDINWLPEHGKGIRLWKETADGRPKLPSGSPKPLAPQQMHCLDEVSKGLNGFIALWGRMANDDLSGEFRRVNEPLSYYWKGVRAALNSPMPCRETLHDGFWPLSRIANEMEDQFHDDGTFREEYAEDALFVGHRRDRPPPSFRVGRDIYAGYFVVVRPANDDPKPFWLARAITNPNPDLGYFNSIQIQYWTLVSSQHVHIDTYDGWDTKEGNLWCEDRSFKPNWSDTDCIMIAWKPRLRPGTLDLRIKIRKVQINIIKLSVESFICTSEGNAPSEEG